jgi:hypothetical protein
MEFEDALNVITQECNAALDQVEDAIAAASPLLLSADYSTAQIMNINAINIYIRFKQVLNQFQSEISYERERLAQSQPV